MGGLRPILEAIRKIKTAVILKSINIANMKELNYWPIKRDVWKFIVFFAFISVTLIIRFFETNQIKNLYASLLMVTLTILSFNGFKKRKILISEDKIEIPISNLLLPKSTKIFKFQQIKKIKEKYVLDKPILTIDGQCSIVGAYLEEEQYLELKKILEKKTNLSIPFQSPTKNQKKRFLLLMWFLIASFVCIFFFSKYNNINNHWEIFLILIAAVTIAIFIIYKFIPIPPTQRAK